MIYTFFGSVRSVESKFLIDKCQKKIFQFLLLTVVLRNSFDIYKAGSLIVILSIWLLHWLASKRFKGLIGEENRDKSVHIRLQTLFILLICFDSLVTYIFAVQFYKHGTKMSDIYIMAGFEVSESTLHLNTLLLVRTTSTQSFAKQFQIPDLTLRALLPGAMAREKIRLQLHRFHFRQLRPNSQPETIFLHREQRSPSHLYS